MERGEGEGEGKTEEEAEIAYHPSVFYNLANSCLSHFFSLMIGTIAEGTNKNIKILGSWGKCDGSVFFFFV